ncbi:MAG: GMC oxidoreductase [Actinomycetales bacterium]
MSPSLEQDPDHQDPDHVVVIGSGFGGSVAALRLVEKGYRVTVLESGRRFEDGDLPRSNWNLPRYLWAPTLGWFGIQRIHWLRDVVVLAGAGVGGGSLNYANTLYQPPASFFAGGSWAGITDWQRELAPHYDQASRMLGVVPNPCDGPVEQVWADAAAALGVSHTLAVTPVGVLFGTPGGTQVPDPYFGGAGPARRTCTECGSCMTGCRVGAKNTLPKNYLALAERAGAQVLPLRTAVQIRPVDDDTGYLVEHVRTGPMWRGRDARLLRARYVVVAAGAWGTQQLLQGCRASGSLPRLSPRLGELTRTNSEALLGAVIPRVSSRVDASTGVAITRSFHPDEHTHVENVRYGRGHNAMGLLGTLLIDGPEDRDLPDDPAAQPGAQPVRGARPVSGVHPVSGAQPIGAAGSGERARRTRVGAFAREALARPGQLLRSLDNRAWSQRTVIGLVMQTRDNSLTLTGRARAWRRRFPGAPVRLISRPGHGQPNPRWIPVGHQAIRVVADLLGRAAGQRGAAGGTVGDLLNIPMTAHFLGGCSVGASAADGVLDAYHRVHGHPGISVVDGAAVSANLGVNPSLTITALAERVFSLWPNNGEADPRPGQHEPYRQVRRIWPREPVVPAGAPGELR